MEVKNRLLNFKNAYIYQNDDWFKFSLDSVLLANFVTINLRTKKILDLATGNAPIPMLLTYRTKAEVYGVELQEEIYNLGQKSIVENDMLNQIHLLNIDVKNTNEYLGFEKFDVVTCNPPYFKTNNEKFYERFVRRFAENASSTTTYTVSFYGVYEDPPKASVEIKSKSNTFNVMGDSETFDMTERIDAIIEGNAI